MDSLKLSNVPHITGDNVILSRSTWEALLKYIQEVCNTVNRQADAIQALKQELSKTRTDVSNLAKIMEDLYHESL